MQPGERESLGEVGLALVPIEGTAGVHLDDDGPAQPRSASRPRTLAARLVAPPRHQVLVLAEPRPSARCRCASRSPRSAAIWQGVGAGRRRVRQVERHVPVRLRDRVPARQVGQHLAVAGPPRVHVLDRERDPVLLRQPLHALDEAGGVVALPPERRVHHDGPRSQRGGQLDRPARSSPTAHDPTPAASPAASAREPPAPGRRSGRPAR